MSKNPIILRMSYVHRPQRSRGAIISLKEERERERDFGAGSSLGSGGRFGHGQFLQKLAACYNSVFRELDSPAR